MTISIATRDRVTNDGDPLQKSARILKLDLDENSELLTKKAASIWTKLANSQVGKKLPGHSVATQDQLTALADMYRYLSHSLNLTIKTDKRTEKPDQRVGELLHNELSHYHSERSRFTDLASGASKEVESHLKKLADYSVDVNCEILTYLAGPRDDGTVHPVCRPLASEWGQIGATRLGCDLTVTERKSKADLVEYPWAGDGTCEMVQPTDLDWKPDPRADSSYRCRCWESVKQGSEHSEAEEDTAQAATDSTGTCFTAQA